MRIQNKRELMIAIVQLGINEYNMFLASMCNGDKAIIEAIKCYPDLQDTYIRMLQNSEISFAEIRQLYMLGHNNCIRLNARALVKQYLRSLETANAQ